MAAKEHIEHRGRRENHADAEAQSQAELGTNMGKIGGGY